VNLGKIQNRLVNLRLPSSALFFKKKTAFEDTIIFDNGLADVA
jgi:hypothetical protein